LALAELYPATEPRTSGFLSVSKLHEIYWEEIGNPCGVPVIFLHGGPGAGIAPIHRRFFDPNYYRVILFDQRGAGKSRPRAETKENTTQDLVSDIEKLRNFLTIERWLVFGGSWGSTLGLVYGETHPERCIGFILRGIFLGEQREIDWFINGMGNFFPEAKQRFLSILNDKEQKNPLFSYLERLQDPNPAVQFQAARAWSLYEQSCSTLWPAGSLSSNFSDIDDQLSLARLEAHYFVNKNFLSENEIIKNLARIRNKPATIIQGRYDVVCPIISANMLVSNWPGAQYKVIPDAGHSALEPGIKRELVLATEMMKKVVTA
tara:strand:+ start:5825 stop:6781 length:957 start_codon:yes stop_codon:yes gene_type:complete